MKRLTKKQLTNLQDRYVKNQLGIDKNIMRFDVIKYTEPKDGHVRIRAIYICECRYKFSIDSKSSILPSFLTDSCNRCPHNPIIRMAAQEEIEALRSIHCGMKERCKNPDSTSFRYYGARGITYCEAWENFNTFAIWALSNGFKKGLSIERRDVNGNYAPDNCEWIPRSRQAANRRNTYNNLYFEYGGEKMNYLQWSERLGISPSVFSMRVKKYGNQSKYVINPPKTVKHCHGKLIRIGNETKDLASWLKENRISRQTYYNRLKRGLPQEQAITMPKPPK